MTWQILQQTCADYLLERGVEDAARLARHYIQDAYAPARADSKAGVTPEVLAKAERDMERLAAGEPLAYVSGRSHFYGYQLRVSSAVLIPRPETEELVRWILETHENDALYFADLCTGSGCIAAALAKQRQTWRGLAIDVSEETAAVATKNLSDLQVDQRVRVECHDVLTDEDYLGEGGEWNLIVSNPPYIPDTDWLRVDPMVASYEPHLALRVTDSSPLLFYQVIEHTARYQLAPGGALYFECNDKYAHDVATLLKGSGWQDVEVFTDMQGKPRHVRAWLAE